MNKKLIVIAGLVAVALSLALLAATGATYAQAAIPPAPGYGPGLMDGYGYGRGGMRVIGATDAYGPMHGPMLDALANSLNLTREELDTRIAAGETPAQIAAAQDISTDEFTQIFADARKAALEEAVGDGYLTQEQANWMLSRMARMAGRSFAGNCPMYPAQTNP